MIKNDANVESVSESKYVFYTSSIFRFYNTEKLIMPGSWKSQAATLWSINNHQSLVWFYGGKRRKCQKFSHQDLTQTTINFYYSVLTIRHVEEIQNKH